MTKSKPSVHCMATHEVIILRSGAHDVLGLAVGPVVEGDIGLRT